jgi:hypothetical protein
VHELAGQTAVGLDGSGDAENSDDRSGEQRGLLCRPEDSKANSNPASPLWSALLIFRQVKAGAIGAKTVSMD